MSKEMKYSGIPWIGDIPRGWNAKRLKFSCKLFGRIGFRGYTADDLVDESEGAITLSPTNMNGIKLDFSKCSYLSWDKYYESPEIMVETGDVLLVKTASVGKCSYVEHLPKETTVNPQILVLKEHKDCSKFIAYLFQTSIGEAYIDTTKGGSTIYTISQEKIGNYEFAFPSLAEQQKIASFLDRKCAEIDEMIALQEKIVEELKAYKQSVITEAVTNGLNPDAPMKDSGTDWIGEIPRHWETIKFKALFQIKKIIAGELGYDVLSVTQQGLRVKDLSKNEGQVAQDYSKYQLVDIDDFVMNHMDLLTGYIDCATISGVTSPDYRTFVNRNQTIAYNPYYLRIFQKCYKDKTFYHLGQGVSFLGRWRLPKEQLNAFVLPLPSLEEQQAIADYLDTKCTEIDNLISVKLSKINSLKEYKKSIIYEYVTGKKEITE